MDEKLLTQDELRHAISAIPDAIWRALMWEHVNAQADALASLTRELEEAKEGARTMRSRCAEVAREAGRKVARASRTSDHDGETQVIDAAQIHAAAAIAGLIEEVPMPANVYLRMNAGHEFTSMLTAAMLRSFYHSAATFAVSKRSLRVSGSRGSSCSLF